MAGGNSSEPRDLNSAVQGYLGSSHWSATRQWYLSSFERIMSVLPLLCRCLDDQTLRRRSAIYESAIFGLLFPPERETRRPFRGAFARGTGVFNSRNINLSDSDSRQRALVHYTSITQADANALGFIHFSFRGRHQFGPLVNDSSAGGLSCDQKRTGVPTAALNWILSSRHMRTADTAFS